MTDETQAREALARAHQVMDSAGRAGRRAASRRMLWLGVASGLVIPVSGLVMDWLAGAPSWARALVLGVLWGAVFGAAATLANSEPVRALPARRLVVVVSGASALVVGASIALGRDFPVAYPIGAVVAFGVCALGALRVRG